MRQQLQQVEKATKRVLPELEEVRNWQGALNYLWEWYVALSASSPLTYLELDAWCRRTACDLTVFEAETIMKLDHLNRTARNG